MAEEKKGFFRRLVDGLTKTRDNIVSSMDSIFNGFTHIDEDFYEELEEVLITVSYTHLDVYKRQLLHLEFF